MPPYPDKLPDGGSDPNVIEKTYTIDVITPLFGGGYEAGTVDPDMPIRASSIRGHLRFWWRATRGARYDNVKELRQREGEIWGSMENPSPVIVEADIQSCGKAYPCAYYPEGSNSPQFKVNHPPYALFPFQGSRRQDIPATKCIAGISFRLTISYPKELSLEVGAALWAWVNFGGIGARTRRGCGALYCQDLSPPDRAGIGEWYRQCLKESGIVPSPPREWPTLPDKILIKDGNGVDALQCWSDVIELLQTFRQGKDVGRNSRRDSPRLGRSRWPEPDSIRRIVLMQKYLDNPPGDWNWHLPDDRISDISFPRAEFGMPIIFEIRGEGIKPSLQPGKDKDRMASPVILKPMKLQNQQCASMILRLTARKVDSAYLKPRDRPDRRDLTTGRSITASEIANPQNNVDFAASPLNKYCNTGSALDAFLAYAKDPLQGFTEVP